jgi:hypothetical protein
VLIENRPPDRSMTATAKSVFWACEIKSFLEDLGFHSLLAQHALDIPDPFL